MTLESAVVFDKGIANDSFKKDKRYESNNWKWMIVLAYGTANILIIPVISSFGLIFKDKFRSINLSALEVTLILNLNSSLGMLLGLFNGALLNFFGFRAIAVLGGFFFSGGIIATAFADSFRHFLITYSIITSIGMGLCTSSFSLALNTYFKENRNKAFGIGATITGFGPIILPHLITFLLKAYGTKGCVLIIGGLSDNSLYKPTSSVSGITRDKDFDKSFDDEDDEYLETCPIYHDVDAQSIYGVDIYPLMKSDDILWKNLDYKFSPKITPIQRSASEHHIRRQHSLEIVVTNEDNEDFYPANTKRWFESGSVASVNLASSLKIFHEDEKTVSAKKVQSKGFLGRRGSLMKFSLLQRRNTVAVIPEEDLPKFNRDHRKSMTPFLPTPPANLLKRRTNFCSKCLQSITNGWKRFVKVFDLGLLSDKIYMNLVMGIAFAIFAEINFSLLTPFILSEFSYSTEQIAIFMSSLATVDIVCRFASPFVGDYFKQPARIMVMYALLMLIIMRTSLMFATSFHGLIFVALGMGLAKGVRQVYMSCIVPSYIPLERLPAASGIQMVTNGVVLISLGSSIGIFHDLLGSYTICIIFINIMTFITLSLWTAEMIHMKRKNEREAKEMEQNQVPELCKFNIEVN